MNRVLILLFISVFTFSLYAQGNYAKKGTIDLGGSISFSSSTTVTNGETDDNSTTTFSFSPVIGYFIIDGLEIALIPEFQTSSYDDNSATAFNLYAAPAYNFETNGKVYPYIAATLGYTSRTSESGDFESTRSGLSYGGAGGVKVVLSEGALLNVGVQYLLVTLNPDGADERYGYNQFAISAGFLFWFN